ncbi:Metapyrocatechase 2 [Beauveria bassiana]|uniref:Metapyrocatechase 2 n=1 Tax=Beauveria bassiana TaxID=176275 RepID=A0A2N6NVM2_BEABA|nr:Metapyrocatechase 2 [Beauveria bassiana]
MSIGVDAPDCDLDFSNHMPRWRPVFSAIFRLHLYIPSFQLNENFSKDALPPPYLDFALACLASAASSKTPHESDGIPILSTPYFDIGIRLYILTLEADNREARTMESVYWCHFGYTTDNYDETCRWYQQHFNFVPTDVLHAPGDNAREVANFMHVERGKTFVDHHSFLLARGDDGKGTKVHHSSFEVEDMDTQMMAHQWLGQTGWTLVWGVGRHVHGSQIFDYWYDSSGYIIEHYADGDVVNQDTETTYSPAGAMAVWGPPVPAAWGGKASAVSG